MLTMAKCVINEKLSGRGNVCTNEYSLVIPAQYFLSFWLKATYGPKTQVE